MRPHFFQENWSERTQLPADFGNAENPLSAYWSTSNRLWPDSTTSQCPSDGGVETIPASDRWEVYVPDNYEPKYAYPLIVWLCAPHDDEYDAVRLTPKISDRNYFGLAIPINSDANEFAGTHENHDAPIDGRMLNKLEAEIFDAVCQLRREYHIHSERIFLAGSGDAAQVALKTVLQRPEWFGGIMTFGGRFSDRSHALTQLRDLPGKRILIGVGTRDPQASVSDAVSAGRVLHAAGMDVSTRIYDSSASLPAKMLNDINHWLMDGIYESNLV